MRRQPPQYLPQSTTRIQIFIHGKYYFIKHPSHNLNLTVTREDISSSQEYNLTFVQQNRFDLQHVWMIEEIEKQTLQIVHPYTSLVLEVTQDLKVKLKPNKQKNSQTFWIEKANSMISQLENNNVFVIKEFKQSKSFVFIQGGDIKCEQRPLYRDECNKWKLELADKHPLIKETCIIENLNSGLVLEVYESRQKQGQNIVQNLMSNHFNQRWQIQTKNESFITIKSLKSGMVLDINNEKVKQGNNIIQWKLKDSPNQLWVLQEHGKRVYLIRSAMNGKFMLGVKGNSLKDEAEVVITKNEGEAFWRIVGGQVGG